MISILIVEDSAYKLEKVSKVLLDDLMIDANLIQHVDNIKAAKRLIMAKTYDLLILDLVLPLDIGDEPSAENGIGFLKDIDVNPSFFPPIHIIGLTEFDDLQKKYEHNFSLWKLINYDATTIDWQEKLKNVIYHLITTRDRFLKNLTFSENYDVAVITALSKPEFEKVLDWPISWKRFEIVNDPTIYYKSEIHKSGKKLRILAACVEQMGMTATAVLCAKIIQIFKPKYLIMGGICAGLKERGLNYGDIVIADQSWDYGSGKMKDMIGDANELKETIFEPDLRPISLSASLKGKINSFLRRKDIISKIQNECKYFKPNTILNAAVGPVASGSYVISSSSKLEEIKKTQRKLLGVEMEGYGVYYTCEHNQDQNVKGLIVKSVSDFGDTNKGDDYQDYSSYTSAQFIYYFILEELL